MIAAMSGFRRGTPPYFSIAGLVISMCRTAKTLTETTLWYMAEPWGSYA